MRRGWRCSRRPRSPWRRSRPRPRSAGRGRRPAARRRRTADDAADRFPAAKPATCGSRRSRASTRPTAQAAARAPTACRCLTGRCARARARRWSPPPTSALPGRGEGARHRPQDRAPAPSGSACRARRRRRGRRRCCWPGTRRCWSSGSCPAAFAELIVGVQRDPVFGPVLSLGAGGVLVELVRDVAHLLLPSDARRHRGGRCSGCAVPRCSPATAARPQADLDGAVDVVAERWPRCVRQIAGVVEARDQPADRHAREPGRLGLRRAAWITVMSKQECAGRRCATRREGAVLEVTLDRPPANAIDLATSRAMGEIFAAFRDDRALRVAVLAHRGRAVLLRRLGPQGGRGGRRRRRRLRRRRLRRHAGAAGAEQAGDRARRGHGGRRRVRARAVLRPDLRGRHARRSRCPRSTRARWPTRRRCSCPPACPTTSPWTCCSPAAGWTPPRRIAGAWSTRCTRPRSCTSACWRWRPALAGGPAAGVRGDQGGAAREPAPDVRRGHARGSRRAGSRPSPRCTPRRTNAKGRRRSPRSGRRRLLRTPSTGRDEALEARAAADGVGGQLAEPLLVLAGEPARVEEAPPHGDVADPDLRVARAQQVGVDVVEADPPQVRHGRQAELALEGRVQRSDAHAPDPGQLTGRQRLVRVGLHVGQHGLQPGRARPAPHSPRARRCRSWARPAAPAS